MIGPGMQSLRPPPQLPPWLAAILTVGGIVLVLNSLPMLAEAITPDRVRSVSFGTGEMPPTPLPLTPDQARRATDRATAGSPPAAQDRDVASSGGDESSSGEASGTEATSGTRPRGPLPVSGASAVAPLVIGTGLLGGGLGLLVVVGFSGERPWPGRYVRRDG